MTARLILAAIAMLGTAPMALAQTEGCPDGFREGYFCETTPAGALLRKGEILVDHGFQLCETTTIVNFGANMEECERAAEAARLGR